MQVGINDDDYNLCSLGSCAEADLLSARCTYCHKMFCSKHITIRAHQCPDAYDAEVASCPLCGVVVPLEYPRQKVDEAVSSHLDYGCRGLEKSTISDASSQKYLSYAPHGGRRLRSQKPCSVVHCTSPNHICVQCDQCGRSFCLDHRNPLLHQCNGELQNQRKRALASDTDQPASKLSVQLDRKATTVASLLATKLIPPLNPGETAQTSSNTVMLLVVFLIPVDLSASGSKRSKSLQVLDVPPFFISVSKNVVLGKLLDLSIAKASKSDNSVLKLDSIKPWYVHALRIPFPDQAVGAMYPPLPLSTPISRTALVNPVSQASVLQKGDGIQSASALSSQTFPLVLISHFSSLPEDILRNLRSLKIVHEYSSQGCCRVL